MTMPSQHTDEEFLEYVVRTISDFPDDVKITRTVDEMGVLLTLKVNPVDMGQVIGRSGSIVNALRLLVKVIGMKTNARVGLKVEEPDQS